MFIAVYFNKSIPDDMDRADMEDRISDKNFEQRGMSLAAAAWRAWLQHRLRGPEEKVSDEEAVRRIRVAPPSHAHGLGVIRKSRSKVSFSLSSQNKLDMQSGTRPRSSTTDPV